MTGTDTFTYALGVDPGGSGTGGTATISDQLLSMGTTFFDQGSQLSAYVLELGAGVPATGVAALQTFITANPGVFYSYLVPREWDTEATFPAFLSNFESTTSKTYFFVTTTIDTYTTYTSIYKDVFALVEAPTIPLTEFSLASAFWVSLHYNPSGANRVTPMAFSFIYGVTQYPIYGNAAILNTLKNAHINVVGTAAEGGLTNTMVSWGYNC